MAENEIGKEADWNGLAEETLGSLRLCVSLNAVENAMKEILRHRDFVKVGHVQSMLEAAGISTFMRNETLSVSEVSTPDFFPAVCVVDDADYERAMTIVSDHFADIGSVDSPDRIYPHCNEQSPGSFGVCWKCEEAF